MHRRRGVWPFLLLAAGLAAVSAPARADYADQAAALCERAIVTGAHRQGVPQEVLHAISLTETGRPHGGRLRPWPWAINREGKGYWFASREEALAFAQASLAEGRTSFDVGCFQINSSTARTSPRSRRCSTRTSGPPMPRGFLRTSTPTAATGRRRRGPTTRRPRTAPSVYRARFDRILAGLGGAPLAVAAATAEPPAAPARAAQEPHAHERQADDHHPRQDARAPRRRARRGGEAGSRPARRRGFVPATGRLASAPSVSWTTASRVSRP